MECCVLFAVSVVCLLVCSCFAHIQQKPFLPARRLTHISTDRYRYRRAQRQKQTHAHMCTHTHGYRYSTRARTNTSMCPYTQTLYNNLEHLNCSLMWCVYGSLSVILNRSKSHFKLYSMNGITQSTTAATVAALANQNN